VRRDCAALFTAEKRAALSRRTPGRRFAPRRIVIPITFPKIVRESVNTLTSAPSNRGKEESTMKRTVLSFCLGGLLLAGCTATVAAPGPPPPPRVERVTVSPGPNYVRVPGHWRWNGRRYVWIDGHWAVRRR
jgi:hypothetical protein